MRAARARLAGRHGRAHAVHPGLVGRGRDDAAAADTPDHDRLAAQRRLVALLDRGEEGVQVEVHHRRDLAHAGNLSPGTDSDAGRPVRRPARRPQRVVRAGVVPSRAPGRRAGGGGREHACGAMTTTLTARRPEDLLAAVPVVLGFRPHCSLVMLTFDAPRCFHARVDLPPPAELDASVGEMVDALLGPGRRPAGGPGRVRLLHRRRVRRGPCGAAAPCRRSRRGEIGVVDVLRAHRGRWWRVPCRPGDTESRARRLRRREPPVRRARRCSRAG